MKIAVLGAGPAGLMATHAAAINNHDVMVFSKDARKSYMRGAQYLHAPIPMVSHDPFVIHYGLVGDVDGYRQKVYGDPRVQVSPESLVGEHWAWDIREAYDALWRNYGDYIQPMDLTPQIVKEIAKESDFVISSIPAKALCYNPEHTFAATTVWATEISRLPQPGSMDNIVCCSGRPDDAWYRTSRIHGWENTEYPADRKPPLSSDKVHEVIKPTITNCDCFPDIRRVGRYGTWTKGVLSHSAFYDTFQFFQKEAKVLEHNQ